jgi:hypothetical protein
MSRIAGFFNSPVQAAEPHPLKVALERKPEEFIHFYQSSLVLAMALLLARVPVVCAALRWYGSCDAGRPLAAWLLMDALLALLQVPLRAGLLAYLPWPACGDAARLASSAMPVLQSQAALISKRLSQVHFIWNLIGVLWGLEAQESNCPLGMLTRFVVALTLIRTGALLWFYHARVCRPPNIATIRYKKERAPVDLFGETSCCVCLGEFAEDQELRQFSCKHAICAGCADRWLQVRRVCPTCMRPT